MGVRPLGEFSRAAQQHQTRLPWPAPLQAPARCGGHGHTAHHVSGTAQRSRQRGWLGQVGDLGLHFASDPGPLRRVPHHRHRPPPQPLGQRDAPDRPEAPDDVNRGNADMVARMPQSYHDNAPNCELTDLPARWPPVGRLRDRSVTGMADAGSCIGGPNHASPALLTGSSARHGRSARRVGGGPRRRCDKPWCRPTATRTPMSRPPLISRAPGRRRVTGGERPWPGGLDDPRLAQAAAFQGARVVASKGVTPRLLHEGAETSLDPHAWQNPRDGLIYVHNIAAGLAAADPAHAEIWRANAAAYAAEIEQTDTWISGQFSAIPPAARRIITTHDAFGYYGDRYGVQLSRR